jgi:hypothetical protein
MESPRVFIERFSAPFDKFRAGLKSCPFKTQARNEGVVLAHPSDKNKYVARVGHPDFSFSDGGGAGACA